MSEIEQRLILLARELDWPETPDLAGSVSARLRAGTPDLAGPVGARLREEAAAERRPAARHWRVLLPPAGLRRSLVLALVGLLVLAGGVFAAIPGVRDAVLEFFGLQGATVERRAKLPAAPRLRPLQLGERTTLEGARAELGFEPLIPRAAGSPDGVFVNPGVPGGELSLTYEPGRGLPATRTTRLGLLVSEFRGDLVPEYLGKLAPQTTRVERVRIDGQRALWIEGAPHFFFYRPPGLEFEERNLRLAQNVLLLERGNLLVRLEGAFSRARAVELALSLD